MVGNTEYAQSWIDYSWGIVTLEKTWTLDCHLILLQNVNSVGYLLYISNTMHLQESTNIYQGNHEKLRAVRAKHYQGESIQDWAY